MDKKRFISELKQGDIIEGVFVVLKARLGYSKNGPYWDLEVQDKTGRIPAKIWHPLSNNYQEIKEDSFVKIKGQVDNFRENLQINVNTLDYANDNEIKLEELIPCSDPPPEELIKELETLCLEKLQYRPWKRLCGLILNDRYIRERFILLPGAVNVHHVYRGGLLEHTLSVCKLSLDIAKNYTDVDREIILVGSLLHDLGKIKEYDGNISYNVTDSGRLLGHIVLGLSMIDPFLEKISGLQEDLILHLKHIIASHHGEYEFGSPKRPMTKEAYIVHAADNIDAKMSMINSAIEELEEKGENWSKYMKFLERKIFKPTHTNEFLEQKDLTKKRSFEECLLPLKE